MQGPREYEICSKVLRKAAGIKAQLKVSSENSAGQSFFYHFPPFHLPLQPIFCKELLQLAHPKKSLSIVAGFQGR